MASAPKNSEIGQETPRVVEVVGAAGVGKTTLCQALNCYNEHIRLNNFPDVRKLADAPFFVRNALQLAPPLLRLYQYNSRQLSRREFAWMLILNGWPMVLHKEVKNNNTVIILDQGPVYLLAEMSEFGPPYLKSQNAQKLWRKYYCRWAAILDMIVWLDAADMDLLERIRTRDQEHIVKDAPAPSVFKFLARYRTAYERVIAILTANAAGPRILRFDTSRERPDEIVSRLLVELGFSWRMG
jgi:hypothetical protein